MNTLTTDLSNLFKSCILIKTIRLREDSGIVISDKTKRLCQVKQYYIKMHMLTSDDCYLMKFKEYSKRITNAANEDFKLYLDNFINS